MACGISGQAFELLADTPVEAFDHSVCLRPEWLCELVDDAALSTQAIERMSAGRSVFGLVLFVYGKAVGPLAAVVGENGVDFDIEAFKEAPQERGGSFATSVIEDFDVDEACRAINRDIGVSPLFVERWQVFDVDVDEIPAGVGVENTATGSRGAWAWRKRRCVAGSGAPDCATASDLYSGATLRRCRRGAEQDLCAIQQPTALRVGS